VRRVQCRSYIASRRKPLLEHAPRKPLLEYAPSLRLCHSPSSIRYAAASFNLSLSEALPAKLDADSLAQYKLPRWSASWTLPVATCEELVLSSSAVCINFGREWPSIKMSASTLEASGPALRRHRHSSSNCSCFTHYTLKRLCRQPACINSSVVLTHPQCTNTSATKPKPLVALNIGFTPHQHSQTGSGASAPAADSTATTACCYSQATAATAQHRPLLLYISCMR